MITVSQVALHYPTLARRHLYRWLCALFMLALSACTQIQLIGDYDDVIDQGVTSVQKKAETYFASFASAPSTPYTQSFYDGIDVDLKVLTTRAQATPKYGLIQQQLGLLQESFKTQRELDINTPRPITQDAQGRSAFSLGLSTIEQQVGQILKLELALKRGESGATAGK